MSLDVENNNFESLEKEIQEITGLKSFSYDKILSSVSYSQLELSYSKDGIKGNPIQYLNMLIEFYNAFITELKNEVDNAELLRKKIYTIQSVNEKLMEIYGNKEKENDSELSNFNNNFMTEIEKQTNRIVNINNTITRIEKLIIHEEDNRRKISN